MNESKISVRYAKALFELGKEKGLIDAIVKDVTDLETLCKESNDFLLMLESPVVKTSQKREVIKNIFADKVDANTLKFLDLVVVNRREMYLKDISRNFLALCRKDKGILSASLTTAVAIEEKGKKELETVLGKAFDAKVELNELVDENIIGGFVIRVEDKQLDASVSSQLNQIKRELLSNHIK